MVDVIRGNVREVPGDLPPLLWWEKVREYSALALDIPWFHPCMEVLSPAELARLKAKALVWWEITGEWPDDTSCWWEIRMARRQGYITEPSHYSMAQVDAEGITRCGHCAATWSPPCNVTRCGLCGSEWYVQKLEVTA